MDRMTDRDYEPEIVDAVQHVANRYGVAGLEDLIALAQEELPIARQALEELAADERLTVRRAAPARRTLGASPIPASAR